MESLCVCVCVRVYVFECGEGKRGYRDRAVQAKKYTQSICQRYFMSPHEGKNFYFLIPEEEEGKNETLFKAALVYVCF